MTLAAPAESDIDLRSDAVTVPTEAMWAAMRSAPLGWRSANDRTVEDLEAYAAALLGKESALFVPTGSMANTLATLAWTTPGDQFVTERRTHVVISEDQAFARLAGIYPLCLDIADGHLTADAVSTAIETRLMNHTARTSLVWLENPHNFAGGTVADCESLKSVSETAHGLDARVHLDGARLFNACAALGVEPRDLAASVDSATINLNKALSAPAGALLCGPAEFIATARARCAGLGGYLSQAGLLAAAGQVALATMRDRVAADNDTARVLCDGIRAIRGLSVPADVPTNIVLVTIESGDTADQMLAMLSAFGIKAMAYDSRTIRLVTHRHIERRHAERVVEAFTAVVNRPTSAREAS